MLTGDPITPWQGTTETVKKTVPDKSGYCDRDQHGVDIDSCVRTRQAVAEELEIPAGWDGTRRARQAVQPRAKLVWR